MSTQQSLRFNGTRQLQHVVLNPDFYPMIPPITSLPSGQGLTTYRLDPSLRAAAWFLTSVSVERQLPRNTTVSLKYNDQRTTHLPQTVNINAPLPGTFAAGQPIYPYSQAAGNIFQYESGAIQKMQWLEVHVTSKLNKRVSFNANYTLMNAHNNFDWNTPGSTPSDPYNLAQDWGRALWNGRHWFNLTGTLMMPRGIQLSPFLIANGGQPYNLTIGSDLNGTTVANERPAVATDLSRPSVVITRFGAFDTNPMPGQKIVPLNYLTGAPSWLINMRVSKTFTLGRPPEATPAGSKGPSGRHYELNFNVDVNNILNHVNEGGFVGNLSSPLFGQSTAMNNGFRDNSNNRKIQFGTQFTF